MTLFRRVMFYVFLLLYLTATPAAILYALGYHVRPGAKKTFERTGVLSIQTEPPGARIYLGASRYRWKTPTLIRDLKPGEYTLRLTLGGHQAWTNVVRVEAERATVREHILLLPEAAVDSLASDRPYRTLIPVPGEELFLLQAGDRAGQLDVCNALRADVRPLLPPEDPFAEVVVTQLHQVRERDGLLIEGQRGDTTVYGWRRLRDEKEPTVDVTPLFPASPERITWDARARDELFTLAAGRLSRVDLPRRALYPDILADVAAFALHRNALYVLDASNRLVRTRRDGESPESLLEKDFLPCWEARERLVLHPVERDVVLLTSAEGALYINRPPCRLMAAGLEGWLLHPDGTALLLWTRDRLGFFSLEDEAAEDVGPAPVVAWFHTLPHRIDQVFWCHKESYLLIAGAGRLDLLPLEEDAQAAARLVARYAPGTAVFYSERAGSVFYLEPGTRHLIRQPLLPRSEIPPLPRLSEGFRTKRPEAAP